MKKILGKGRRERIGKLLLGKLIETRRYWKLKEEALDHTVWGTRFGKNVEIVVREIA
jgi:hypothetical protein